MAWMKRLQPAEPPKEEPLGTTQGQTENAEDATACVPLSPRYSKRGQRRGQHPVNAVLGLIVLIFALIGMVSTIIFGINTVRALRDTSYLKEEMYYTLFPLMQYAPTAFTDVKHAEQTPLMQATLYEITNREWIRQQQDKNYVTPYTTDEFGRTVVPAAAVEEAYHALFGKENSPVFQTFGVGGDSYFSYEYDSEKKVYHVPLSTSSSAYEPVIDTIQRAGETYTVRVGYVHLQDVTVDDYGNKIVALDKATYFQLYTVERTEESGFLIRAIADEKPNE